jgi:hypothetical protein
MFVISKLTPWNGGVYLICGTFEAQLLILRMYFINSSANIYEFSPYLKENTFYHTKINWSMLCNVMIAVYTENHTRSINTKCRASD